MPKIQIDIQVKSKKWLAIKNIEKFIKKICPKLILSTEIKSYLRKKSNSLEIAIILASDAQIKKINQQFRGKNKATDVLSFSFLDENLIRQKGFSVVVKNQSYIFLGDIVLSLDTIAREAISGNKSFNDHLTHLLLHSILHLIGYDHQISQDAQIMENIEIKILNKLKIKNPY